MDDSDWRPLLERYGPQVVVTAVFAFMVWVRTLPRDRVILEGDVYFSGNDPWYHARIVQYIVRTFPATPDFDAWSYFPYGTGRHSGFGGLFDQLIAGAALFLGAGNPSDRLVEVVTAYAPPVFGALTVIPAYLVAKRLMGRWWGLLTAVLLGLVNGQFLTRTIVGVSDHQSAEAFFGTLAVLGFLYVVEIVYAEQPTTADLQDRNWTILRRPIVASLLGGVAIASYLTMWPQGVMLVFTFGVFVVLQLVRDHRAGRSQEYLTLGTIGAMGTAAVITLSNAKSITLSSSGFSLLQPVVLLGVAVGAGVIFVTGRYYDRSGYERRYYPGAVAGLIVLAFSVAFVAYPPSFGMFRELVVRVYSFGLLTSPSALTVAEISPATPGDAWRAYTMLFPLAIVGLGVLALRVARENRPLDLLVLLWSLTIFSAYFTMIRFGYYLGVTVAVLSTVSIWWTARLAGLSELRSASGIETYQILVILIVVVSIVPGNIVAVGGTSAPVWDTADAQGGTNTAWQSELKWMANNTPEVNLEYYGDFEQPADGDFDYPPEAYGVMSWWDYGHWITYTGHRIPNANPFQQGPRPASAFLLAENETRANLILEALASEGSKDEIPTMSIEELRATVNAQSSVQRAEDTRYVVIDDQMAAGKFSAIATWTGPGPGAFFGRQEFQVADTRARLLGTNDRYSNTMLAKLYLRDAQGLSHYRLVHETGQSAIVSVAQQSPGGQWESTNFIHRRLSSSVFTVVQQRPDLAFYNVFQPATVKTFERVPGATLTGQVDTENSTTVYATVRLQTNRGRNFTYVQSVETDEDGTFEMTVPYATTDTIGPDEGGTNSSVEALGKYELFAGNPFQPTARGNTSVPEPAVYDAETITVELEPVEQSPDDETNSSSSSNSSSLGVRPGQPPNQDAVSDDDLGSSTSSRVPAAAPRRTVDG